MDLTVEGVAYGAKGVARHEGKVYFIADAIAGDRVQAKIVSDNGRYGEAEVTQLLTPSPFRGEPACAFAAQCGGCQWMGISYPQQLEWKRGFVASALTRIGKLNGELAVSIIPAPAVLAYRNRILLRLHVTATGALVLGYFRRQSRELVPITQCAVAAPAINAVIEALRATDVAGIPELKARVELQEIVSTPAGQVVVTIYPGDGERQAMEALARLIAALPGVHWSGLVFALPDAPTVQFDAHLERTFLTKPGQFQQVNRELNRTLRGLLSDYVEAAQPARILDVFCGSGNLSLPLADGIRYIEGIEANKQAITVARRNVEANMLGNVRYLVGDSEKHLWKCDRAGEHFDLVILDPPRQGLFKGMVPLKNIGPRSIVYVSCDPTTLARDLGYLCRNDAYKIKNVVALDFFPNTYHVETIAFLERTSERPSR